MLPPSLRPDLPDSSRRGCAGPPGPHTSAQSCRSMPALQVQDRLRHSGLYCRRDSFSAHADSRIMPRVDPDRLHCHSSVIFTCQNICCPRLDILAKDFASARCNTSVLHLARSRGNIGSQNGHLAPGFAHFVQRWSVRRPNLQICSRSSSTKGPGAILTYSPNRPVSCLRLQIRTARPLSRAAQYAASWFHFMSHVCICWTLPPACCSTPCPSRSSP